MTFTIGRYNDVYDGRYKVVLLQVGLPRQQEIFRTLDGYRRSTEVLLKDVHPPKIPWLLYGDQRLV